MAHPMLSSRPEMRSFKRGFTLTELMIVVAIVGVLAALGVYGLRRYQQYAGTGEATGMLQGMRGAQENFKAENLVYGGCTAAGFVNAGANIGTGDFYPRTAVAPPSGGSVDDRKAAWDMAGDPAIEQCFRAVGFRSDGPVRFVYAAVAGPPGTALPTNPAGIFGNAMTNVNAPTEPWYILVAAGNRDNDNLLARLHTVSLNNSVYMEQDTE